MPTCLGDSYTQGCTQIVFWDTLASLEIRTSASEQSLLDHSIFYENRESIQRASNQRSKKINNDKHK